MRHIHIVGGEGRADAGFGVAINLPQRAPSRAKQGLLALARAILHLHLEAACIAQAIHSRWGHNKHARALNLLNRAIDLAQNCALGFIRRGALIERIETKENNAFIGRRGKASYRQAGESDRIFDAGHFQCNIRHAPNHIFRAI